MQSDGAVENAKIYAPKPTRFKPSWSVMEKSESVTEEYEKGTSDASSGTNYDVDLASWSHDDHGGEFDQTVVGFHDATHLDFAADFFMQDESLQRLYDEYSQLLQLEVGANQLVEPLMQ